MSHGEGTEHRRELPAIGVLIESEEFRTLLARAPRASVVSAARRVVAQVRAQETEPPATPSEWAARAAAELESSDEPSLRAVINATGVVLHTNLGRAPLAEAAARAIQDTALGTSNLEYNLDTGKRGSRYTHCVDLLRELTGCEDAIVVNNCAAGLVLGLNSVTDGREAIISRGELIEIGGSFRVPDIMAKSGAVLCEVGTTNRTHIDDYRRALGPRTGAIVKVHRSNFEQRGFVADTTLGELAALAREASVPSLFDFGSGLMLSLARYGLGGELTAREAVQAGASLVVMSGDKLLGGPQAGIVMGSKAAVSACRTNPLARALRVDKLTIAALEATLRLYREPTTAIAAIPILSMLCAPLASIRERAVALCSAISVIDPTAEVVSTEATVGGGAFPTARIPSFGVRFRTNATRLEAALRAVPLPVIGRIERGAVVIDLRSVPDQLDAGLRDSLAAAAGLASA